MGKYWEVLSSPQGECLVSLHSMKHMKSPVKILGYLESGSPLSSGNSVRSVGIRRTTIFAWSAFLSDPRDVTKKSVFVGLHPFIENWHSFQIKKLIKWCDLIGAQSVREGNHLDLRTKSAKVKDRKQLILMHDLQLRRRLYRLYLGVVSPEDTLQTLFTTF